MRSRAYQTRQSLIGELRPAVLNCLGKRAAEMFHVGSGRPSATITWNRAQAVTPRLIAVRKPAAEQVFEILGRRRS